MLGICLVYVRYIQGVTRLGDGECKQNCVKVKGGGSVSVCKGTSTELCQAALPRPAGGQSIASFLGGAKIHPQIQITGHLTENLHIFLK